MSGHNRWSKIKHKKGNADARRGRAFTKIIRELTVAARAGGGDIDANPRLRAAAALARAENMPKDTMDRAIKRGTGDLEGVNYEDGSFEGYGPGGVAIYMTTLSDNKNRTTGEVRHLLSKYGGNLGQDGSVAWMFKRKGHLLVGKDKTDEDSLMAVVLEAGAEDIRTHEDHFEILTTPDDFDAVQKALQAAGIEADSAAVTLLPVDVKRVTGKEAVSLLKLLDALEENDDVQQVYANHEIDEDALAAFQNA
jgi:YebC/PmpR family DNA-binding regulatory protein